MGNFVFPLTLQVGQGFFPIPDRVHNRGQFPVRKYFFNDYTSLFLLFSIQNPIN